MWYFAYGSNLNTRAVTEWCRHYGHRPPALKNIKPAILENYRLCFPIFSEYWSGGIADIVYDPGKNVSGGLVQVTEAELRVLDQKVNRVVNSAGRDVGTYRLIEVPVAPFGAKNKVKAYTYQGVSVEKYHIPPTQHYMDLVIEGAYANGLSMMWISYLKTFSIQQGRKPRPQGYGDNNAPFSGSG